MGLPLSVKANADPILPFLTGKQEIKVIGETNTGEKIDKNFSNPSEAFAFAKKIADTGIHAAVLLRYEDRKPLPDLQKMELDPEDPSFNTMGGTWAHIGFFATDGQSLKKVDEAFGWFDALGRRVNFTGEDQ